MIKADFHLHTKEDPFDLVSYTAEDLLDRAVREGYGALAVTLHLRVFADAELFARARKRGVLMFPSAEANIEGADVVLLNVTEQQRAAVRTFSDLRRLRQQRGPGLFTIAPHPFYPVASAVGSRLEKEIDCFDAIELSRLHHRWFNPNAPAAALAARVGKPMVATSDAHRAGHFGRNYTLVDCPSGVTVEEFFAAMRAGRLRTVSPELTLAGAVAEGAFLFALHPAGKLIRAAQRWWRKETLPKRWNDP